MHYPFVLATALGFALATERVDTFDDLPGTSGIGIGDGPTLTSDGGISYENFHYFSKAAGINSLTGIEPKSAPNIAVAKLPAEGSLVSASTCFELRSLYFGCTTVNEVSAVNIPLPCTLHVAAFDAADRELGSQSFEFTPTGLASEMTQAMVSLPPTVRVSVNASILDIGGGLGETLTALLIDNVAYTEYDSGEDCGGCGEN